MAVVTQKLNTRPLLAVEPSAPSRGSEGPGCSWPTKACQVRCVIVWERFPVTDMGGTHDDMAAQRLCCQVQLRASAAYSQ